jgi:hypothetical protein
MKRRKPRLKEEEIIVGRNRVLMTIPYSKANLPCKDRTHRIEKSARMTVTTQALFQISKGKKKSIKHPKLFSDLSANG